MKPVPATDGSSLLPSRPKRPPRFAIASLAMPFLGVLVCAVAAPGSERRAGEMFSTGTLICLFAIVGGAVVGLILAGTAIARRESPAALTTTSLVLNAAIVIYSYF